MNPDTYLLALNRLYKWFTEREDRIGFDDSAIGIYQRLCDSFWLKYERSL
jgi:beta-phosphoglucomutase-like phosphatase (HAD superfamily)